MARLMATGSLRDHLSTSSSIFVALAALRVHRQPNEDNFIYLRAKVMKKSHTFSCRGASVVGGTVGGWSAASQFFHFLETLVQAQVVTHGILPAGRCRSEIRKMFATKEIQINFIQKMNTKIQEHSSILIQVMALW